MKTILKIISFSGLVLTVIPAFMHFYSEITWDTHADLMLAGMIVWFLTAPVWMKKKG